MHGSTAAAATEGAGSVIPDKIYQVQVGLHGAFHQVHDARAFQRRRTQSCAGIHAYATAFLKSMTDRIPAGRLGEPDELVLAALYLASDESRFVNGAELRVGGGMFLTRHSSRTGEPSAARSRDRRVHRRPDRNRQPLSHRENGGSVHRRPRVPRGDAGRPSRAS